MFESERCEKCIAFQIIIDMVILIVRVIFFFHSMSRHAIVVYTTLDTRHTTSQQMCFFLSVHEQHLFVRNANIIELHMQDCIGIHGDTH